MPRYRIRSVHQRRLLDWLADGGGTVSDASDALGIRMPHASAALKRLRESGDIVRDHGSRRGANHRLTAQGLMRLEQDGLDRLLHLVDWPPPKKALGIVLARDREMVLLGYTSDVLGPLMGLPNRPLKEDHESDSNSIGNEGVPEMWRWAVLRGEGPIWWDLETQERTKRPVATSSSNLSAWTDQPKVMGVMRARLLEDAESWPLGVGSWFAALPEGLWPDLPENLRAGSTAIGRAGSSGPTIRPLDGIHARLSNRHDKTLALRAYSSGSLVLADSKLLGHKRTSLPTGCLSRWISLVHPRLSTARVIEKSQKLCLDLEDNSLNSLTRAILGDFGGRDWHEEQKEAFIDTGGLSLRGATALLQWCLEETDVDLVVEWRWPVADSKQIITRLVSDPRCRLLLSDGDLKLPLRIESTANNGQVMLHMKDRVRLPVRLDALAGSHMIPTDWVEPRHPRDLQRGGGLAPSSPPQSHREAMWIACDLENGDSRWAELCERTSPLAAFIATPKDERISRWRRLRESLNPVWSSLLDFDALELSELAELAITQEEALDSLVARIRSSPMVVIDEKMNEGLGAAILLARQWFDEEFRPLLIESAESWARNPLAIEKVMPSLWMDDELRQIALRSEELNPYRMMSLGEVDDPDTQRQIICFVHPYIWLDYAKQWLLIQLSSSTGRSVIASMELPWPALLWRDPPSVEELRVVHHLEEGPGKNSLLDVLDALESDYAPPTGRTHPLAGWLFRSTIPFISSEVVGDETIHLELYRRFHQ